MIKITSLTKVYKSKKRRKSTALSDINLTLDDSGLVFVLGKSGSGKSTLLNLIGGLDSITSGKIEVDGNDISDFSEKTFANYRNTHIGFVFQDYHLIDELTVYDNIVLSLNLRRIEDRDKVKSALEKVDLAGYEDRYPTELSGGEQQRVAIARAIVKNPRIILADEPTGNLDTNTAKAIVELLSDLSKECLILIVSHNINDANNYADRIIELSRGKIISDRTKNPDFPDAVRLSEEGLLYPANRPLLDEDIELINSNRTLGIVKRSDKFIPTGENKAEAKKVKIDHKSLTFGKSIALSGKFLKNKIFSITLSSFMVAVIMVIMALAQTIIAFDANRIISEEMNKNGQDSLLLNKGISDEVATRLDGQFYGEATEEDIEAFYNAGYGGKIYPVLNISVPITEFRNSLGIKSSYLSDSVYIRESLGTMIVDEEFFEKKFGKFEYIAKLENPLPEGVIITDYIADAILATNHNYIKRGYEDILGDYVPDGFKYDSVKVSAIVYTGYKERHNALFEKVKEGVYESFSDCYKDNDFIAFSSEVFASLGYSYSLLSNYVEEAHLTRDYASVGTVVFDNNKFASEDDRFISFQPKEVYPGFNGSDVVMSYVDYNAFFGTKYEPDNLDSFVPHTVTMTSYRREDVDKKNPLYTIELYIEKLMTVSDMIIMAVDTFEEEEIIRKSDIYYSSLYFDGVAGIEAVLETAEILNYDHQSFTVEGIYTMTKAVKVFVPIFELIAIILFIGVIFILVSFGTKMINDKMHEIGIMKAIGGSNKTILSVFGPQVVLIALVTSVMTTIGYCIFIDLANTVLIESLRILVPSKIVLDLNFLEFIPRIAFTNCLSVIGLSLASLIVPFIKINLIEPVKIIKAKE